MTSQEIKTAALCWLRFGRAYPYVCTEAGRWNADVIGASSAKLVEVEVKISKSDLKLDFFKPKHGAYSKITSYYRGAGWVPNAFYYAVPQDLESFTLELLKEEALKIPNIGNYGVLVFDSQKQMANALSCAKKARGIHAVAPSEKVLNNILLRMGSELTNFHIYSNRYKTWLNDMKEEAKQLSKAIDIDAENGILEESGSNEN